MKSQLVVSTAATLAATSYPVASYNTPFLRGNRATLMIVKTGNFDAGNVTVRTDNNVDSAGAATWTTVRAAATADAATTVNPELIDLTLGDNIEITVEIWVAGTISFYLLGDS